MMEERQSSLQGGRNVSGNKLASLTEMEVQQLSLPSALSQLSLCEEEGKPEPSTPECPGAVPPAPKEAAGCAFALGSHSACAWGPLPACWAQQFPLPQEKWGTLPALCHRGQFLRKGITPHLLGPGVSPCPPQAVALSHAPCPHPLFNGLLCPAI